MKTIRSLSLASFLLLILSFVLVSCSKNGSGGNSRVQFMLTDNPLDNVDAVNIEIVGIEIHSSNDPEEKSGWKDLELVNPGVYNLLEFTNGMDTLLADVELPAGKISQLRLKLGNDNSIVIDGQEKPLSTPSAQQSGLKLNIHQDLVAGVTYKIWIDFDVTRSIVHTGSGTYSLKPVIRTFTEATSGSIKGVVLPAEANPVVFAVSGTDTLTALPDANGRYLIRGVQPASWNLIFDADNTTGYIDQTKNGINVTLGNVTVVDTVRLVK